MKKIGWNALCNFDEFATDLLWNDHSARAQWTWQGHIPEQMHHGLVPRESAPDCMFQVYKPLARQKGHEDFS
eukprot:CAMPEP_0177455744 /NCGR_PEP_ID=MMETSP0369-20130122/12077_1 /TAXON_ID=447022 ORGANISM="Scrippsiella hangoei-like, Strain SHHI-4" /NCGR_SAMPLE_ID=MMETSP0369 /ASSEMBLY_ACC=CAM_ASM_000364 /LENGTH=71 /DNA_ID=CAMNT_0018928649 /DNA_START=341 /DNA_END=556 /DNA_ORIENTATION=-